jgi:hypothetical protein
MIAAHQIAFGKAAGKGLSAKDYVQDGLVRHIDGIENVGLGLSHDATALGWTDLSTGEVYPFSVNGEVPNWQDGNCWRSVSVTENRYFIANCPDLATTQGSTIEVVVKKTTAERGVIIGDYNLNSPNKGCNIEYYSVYSGNNFRAYFSNHPNIIAPFNSFPLGETKYFATVRDGNIYSVRQGDGSILTTVESEGREWIANTYNIGRDGRSTMCWGGDIYAIRIYNRALTAEEIAHNYSIDKARFGL